MVPIEYKRQVTVIVQALRDTQGVMSAQDAALLIQRSRRHVRRIFIVVTGKSFREEQCSIRFSCAQQLVRTSTLTIEEIAVQMQYANRGKFDSAYRRAFGITPAAERASMRQPSSFGVPPEPQNTPFLDS